MKKSELINEVSEATGLSEIDSKMAVDAVFDSIIKGLREDKQVKVFGFGILLCEKIKAWSMGLSK